MFGVMRSLHLPAVTDFDMLLPVGRSCHRADLELARCVGLWFTVTSALGLIG